MAASAETGISDIAHRGQEYHNRPDLPQLAVGRQIIAHPPIEVEMHAGPERDGGEAQGAGGGAVEHQMAAAPRRLEVPRDQGDEPEQHGNQRQDDAVAPNGQLTAARARRPQVPNAPAPVFPRPEARLSSSWWLTHL